MNLPDPELAAALALAAGLLPLLAVSAARVRRVKLAEARYPAEARCPACGRPDHEGPACER